MMILKKILNVFKTKNKNELNKYEPITVKEAIDLSNNVSSESVYLVGGIPATIVGAKICYIDSPIQSKPSILLHVSYKMNDQIIEHDFQDWEFWDNHQNLNGEILWE